MVTRGRLCPLRSDHFEQMDKRIDVEAIVGEHYAVLYRFGLALAKNESDAADLTQQTFLILTKHQNQIRETEKVKTWLFTTLRREFLRNVRERTAHPEVEFQPGRHETAVESGALNFTDYRSVLAALEMVEETYRSTLELFYLGDLSYKEISVVLGIPIGTVMSRLSRGKQELRSALTMALEGDPKVIPFPEHRSPEVRDDQKGSRRNSECLPHERRG
jgi:RNA polymerase sigma-70 factor, ECF subfamily